MSNDGYLIGLQPGHQEFFRAPHIILMCDTIQEPLTGDFELKKKKKG